MSVQYFSKMMGYSKKASAELGIDYRVILAQWYLETGGGTSEVSIKANNHAGIKSNSKGRDGIFGRYAKYNNLTNYTKDYIRVMNLPYYDQVRNAKGLEEQIRALDKSPWAEDKEYGTKLLNVIKKNDLANISPVDFLNGGGIGETVLNIVKSPLFIGGVALIVVLKG